MKEQLGGLPNLDYKARAKALAAFVLYGEQNMEDVPLKGSNGGYGVPLRDTFGDNTGKPEDYPEDAP